jgi:lipopolysaccharide/colanic/teichoic acid biosynthesis glycosyltransferase
MSVKERILLDVNYAQNSSVWTDFSIMLKTLPAMIQKEEI